MTVDPRDVQAAIGNARILLAENNVFNQQVAREFLEAVGCVVHVANNGAEALDWLRREHFDCVLMDVQMPLLDGLEATRQIRSNQAFAAMPVIAVTANALEEEQRRCMEAGMNDFITKPLRPETLYAVLAKWLARQVLPLSLPERKTQAEGITSPGLVIDLTVLSELVGGSQEKMRQMAYRFMDCTRQDMEKVRAALEQSDWGRIKEMAHHIKAPASMVGAAGFADLCRELEGNSDNLEHLRQVVERMHDLLAEIELQIETQLT
jgi:CheY-like chemotaxis protein/HPt (histidine-containing phosphotransfer) domain-containing protein